MKHTVESLKDLEIEDLIFFWNEFCYENRYENEIVDNTEEYWEMYAQHRSVSELVVAISFGNFDFNDEYLTIDGYARFKTFTFLQELHDIVDFDELVIFVNEKIENEEI
jgi:hypothetical protein